MTAKKHFPKSIYSLLLIFMLVLGTCLGGVQTVSGSAHALLASSDSSANETGMIRPAGETLPIQHFLIGKSTGNPETTAIHNKRSTQKTNLHFGRVVSYLLSTIGLLPAKKNIFSYPMASRLIRTRFGHMVIIGYIHQKDGQKSCIPFLS